MAAACLRRSFMLQISRSCGRRYCSASWRSLHPPIRRVVPHHKIAVCNRRSYSSEQYTEPVSGYAYSNEHEWVSTDYAGGLNTVGISNFAQDKLGEIVFSELPEVGAILSKGDILGVLESVKAAEDVHSPVGGTVLEINSDLVENPALINKDPYEEGWLLKLKDVPKKDFKDLMNSEEYKAFIEKEL